MDIFLTNNLNNKKEKFVPNDHKNIGMYVCGPTVYDDPHIGNARPLVIFDVLFKLLKNNFSKVTYVRNITDIDDKIIKSSQDQKISTKELTEKITSGFFVPLSKTKRVRIHPEDDDIKTKMEGYKEKGLESILLAESDYFEFVKKIKHGLIGHFLNDQDDPKQLDMEQMLGLVMALIVMNMICVLLNWYYLYFVIYYMFPIHHQNHQQKMQNIVIYKKTLLLL